MNAEVLHIDMVTTKTVPQEKIHNNTFYVYYPALGNCWDLGTCSSYYGHYKWAKHYKTDFDILYNGEWTTYKKTGWWPIFEVDNSGNQVSIRSLKAGIAEDRGVKVRTQVSKPFDSENFLLIEFLAECTDGKPHKVSIASHTDVMIKNHDNANILWYGDKSEMRGFTMWDKLGTNRTLTLITKQAFGVRDVDHLWFGHWESNGNLHYFDDRNAGDFINDQDSAFSFGWANHSIYPENGNYSFGVLLGLGIGIGKPPTVSVNESNFKQIYSPGEEVEVWISADDADKQETVIIKCTLNGKTVEYANKTVPYDSKTDKSAAPFKVNLGTSNGCYPLYCWAIDSSGLSSQNYTRNFIVDEAPILTIFNQLPDKFTDNSAFNIQGSVWDDSMIKLKFRVDDDFYFNVDNENIECNKSTLTFLRQIVLKTENVPYGTHILYIWAEDEYGVKSDEYIHTFEYVKLNAPTISLILNDEDKTKWPPIYHYNAQINLKVQYQDKDVGDNITISYRPPTLREEDTDIPLWNEISNGTIKMRDFHYTIPKLDNGTHDLKFIIHDGLGLSSTYANYTFLTECDDIPSPTPSPQSSYEETYSTMHSFSEMSSSTVENSFEESHSTMHSFSETSSSTIDVSSEESHSTMQSFSQT